MDFEQKLAAFSELVVKYGINVQTGEEVSINSPIECAPFARKLAKYAYELGAKYVEVNYGDDEIAKLNYNYATTDELCDIRKWRKIKAKESVERKMSRISIYSEDPELLAGIDPHKIASVMKATSIAMRPMREATSNNTVKWCVISVPNVIWAKKLYPKMSEKAAMDKLWEDIFTTMRVNTENPVKAWAEHTDKLQKRCDFLTSHQFKALKYTNSIGTDFTVELPENHLFLGGSEKSKDGCVFIANMPTEEVFSAPLRTGAEGRLVSAMPLCHNGVLINDFFMQFKNGHVVDFGAKQGYETLKGIIETDEGSHYLGEVALVGYNNPIRNLDMLFLNTLFDENASCHFALGKGYPCVKGGDKMSAAELKKAGVNDSLTHVDFMIGTSDLSIVGIEKNGDQIEIMKDGDFVI